MEELKALDALRETIDEATWSARIQEMEDFLDKRFGKPLVSLVFGSSIHPDTLLVPMMAYEILKHWDEPIEQTCKCIWGKMCESSKRKDLLRLFLVENPTESQVSPIQEMLEKILGGKIDSNAIVEVEPGHYKIPAGTKIH
jgi:hypothetical protein